MQILQWLCFGLITFVLASAQSTAGISALVKRRMPNHVDSFAFSVVPEMVLPSSNETRAKNDAYKVSSTTDGKILVEGSSLSAIASG